MYSFFEGWAEDYLVMCAFLSVRVNVIQNWLISILAEACMITVLTVIVCLYFGRRIGGTNDFERCLGLLGTCIGTVPSGIALVRTVAPRLKTTTAIELGLVNLVMLLSTLVYLAILAAASKTISLHLTLVVLGVCT